MSFGLLLMLFYERSFDFFQIVRWGLTLVGFPLSSERTWAQTGWYLQIQNSTHTWILGTPDFLMATQAYICKTYLYTQASSTSSEFSSSNLLIVSSITKYHGQAKKEFREELELFLIGSKQFDACHARRMRQEG